MYIIAGSNNDVHVFDFLTNTWKPVTSIKGTIPMPRYRQTACVWDHYIFVFGGQLTTHNNPVNELWRLDLQALEWKLISCSGVIPKERSAHTAITYNDLMCVFGGCGCDTSIWALDYKKLKWKCLHRVSRVLPSRLLYHSAVLYRNSMIVFGGHNDSTWNNYLFEYSFERDVWKKWDTSGEIPCARYGHTAVVHADSMYVFSGYDGTKLCTNDTYEFNFITGKWKKLHCTGQLPTNRSTHSAVVYMNSMYIFAGYDKQPDYCNDLYWLYLKDDHKMLSRLHNHLIEKKLVDIDIYCEDE